ncbi:ABC transporter substrate-binding protein [Cupriavidus basilensis]
MASLIAEHAAAHGVKTIAYIGFANALGEAFLAEVQRFADLKHMRITDTERFRLPTNSVTAQVLHLLANKPDAVVIGGSGTPAALPARALAERGYTGKIYFNHGVSNNDFVRAVRQGLRRRLRADRPRDVAAELPDANPAKKQALDFARRYEAALVARAACRSFAAYTGDIGLLLQRAVPVALKRAKPGTPAFREALRGRTGAGARPAHQHWRGQHEPGRPRGPGPARARDGADPPRTMAPGRHREVTTAHILRCTRSLIRYASDPLPRTPRLRSLPGFAPLPGADGLVLARPDPPKS